MLRIPRPRLPLLGGVGNAYIRKVLGTEPADLLCYWPLGDKSGAVADNARGDPAFDAAYTGVTLGEAGIGDGGTCPWFDGANDYVDVFTAALVAGFDGNEGTVFWWMKVTDAGVWSDSTTRKAFALSCGPSIDDDWIVCQKVISQGRVEFYYAPGESYKMIVKTGLSDTGWIPCAMTFSQVADVFRVYLYGAEIEGAQSGLNAWTQEFVEGRCYIGSAAGAPAQIWDGWLAHFAIWNKALSADQVASLSVV